MRTELVKEYFNKYAEDIYRYAYARCNDQELAEDVTSAAFEALINSDKDINKSEVKYWLMRVSKNKIVDRSRKSSKVYANLDQIANTEFDVEQSDFTNLAVEESLVNLVQKELESLNPEVREVIALRIWEQMSFKEISEVLNEKESTVKKRFYRGIEYIKLKIQREEKEDNQKTLAAIWAISGLTPYQLPVNFNFYKILGMKSIHITSATGYVILTTIAAISIGTGFLLGRVTDFSQENLTPIVSTTSSTTSSLINQQSSSDSNSPEVEIATRDLTLKSENIYYTGNGREIIITDIAVPIIEGAEYQQNENGTFTNANVTGEDFDLIFKGTQEDEGFVGYERSERISTDNLGELVRKVFSDSHWVYSDCTTPQANDCGTSSIEIGDSIVQVFCEGNTDTCDYILKSLEVTSSRREVI